MPPLPDLITHNYHPARGIGGNICDLPRDEAERILDGLRAMGRGLRPGYLEKRRRVEDWLIAEKNKRLGETALRRPIYFFLGDFADGKDASRPEALVMPLRALSPGILTFTYADSMSRYQMGLGGSGYPYGSVFTRSEIEDVAARFGGWEKGPGEWPEVFIEVQVWDDRPIRDWVAKAIRCGTGGDAVGINGFPNNSGSGAR